MQKKYKFEKLMAIDPTHLGDTKRFGISLYEHPRYGDEHPVIAVLNGVAWDPDFYDPWNDCDQSYIYEQAVELGLLPTDTECWEAV